PNVARAMSVYPLPPPPWSSSFSLHDALPISSGYHHKLSIQVSDEEMPSSVIEMVATLEIGGHRFTQTFAPQPNVEAVFYWDGREDRKSTRLNPSHVKSSYAVFCLKKKTKKKK